MSAENHVMVKGWSRDGRIAFPAIVLPMRRVRCWQCGGLGTTWITQDFDLIEDEAGCYANPEGYEGICPQCDGTKTQWQIDRELCMTQLSTYKGLLRYDNWLKLTMCGRTRHDYDPRLHESRGTSPGSTNAITQGGMAQGHQDRLL